MCSKPQAGAVKRSHLWVLVASILVVGGVGAGEARGDIQVHVMNCASSSTVGADAYDSKDSVKMVAASSASVSTGNNRSLNCAGEGQGYCQMTLTFKGSPERCYGTPPNSTSFHLDSGKWAVVKGFEITSSCYTVIQQYDSQPANCEAVCGNCY